MEFKFQREKNRLFRSQNEMDKRIGGAKLNNENETYPFKRKRIYYKEFK